LQILSVVLSDKCPLRATDLNFVRKFKQVTTFKDAGSRQKHNTGHGIDSSNPMKGQKKRLRVYISLTELAVVEKMSQLLVFMIKTSSFDNVFHSRKFILA